MGKQESVVTAVSGVGEVRAGTSRGEERAVVSDVSLDGNGGLNLTSTGIFNDKDTSCSDQRRRDCHGCDGDHDGTDSSGEDGEGDDSGDDRTDFDAAGGEWTDTTGGWSDSGSDGNLSLGSDNEKNDLARVQVGGDSDNGCGGRRDRCSRGEGPVDRSWPGDERGCGRRRGAMASLVGREEGSGRMRENCTSSRRCKDHTKHTQISACTAAERVGAGTGAATAAAETGSKCQHTYYFSDALSAGGEEDTELLSVNSEGSGNGYIEDGDGDSSSGDKDSDDDDAGKGEEDPLEPIPGEVKLVPSMFPDRSPTVFFEYPKELAMARFDNSYYSEPLGGRRLLFKTHWERNSVKNAFFRAGFSRTRSTLTWTASWGKHPTREGFRNLNRFQKVNHFPGSWCIGRKDRLLRTLGKHKRELNGAASLAAAAAAAARGGVETGTPSRTVEVLPPSPLDFSPDGFVLPADRRAWLKAVEAEPKAIWIVKPPASSCGRGIRVINKAMASTVSKTKKYLVQRYIHNPMLIDGRKFDLRLYILVTSMDPLRVYLFEEGLVRLSTKPYTLKNLRSRFTHLTNYSINKRSGSFKAPEDSDGQETQESTAASKWALTFFWKFLEKTLGKERLEQVKRSIEDVVLRTMAAADGHMTTHSHQATRHRGCCYELFGFDVLLDEHLKPWLLEVNISPSLFGSSALDRRIKGTLMADIFHLVGFRPFDRTALRREQRKEARHIPGTRRAARTLAGRPQDAWRRCQTPASIKLEELGEDEWEVIRDTEDEQHRAGHFRILYPTAENVTLLWPLFRNPRFLNGVLARWVLTGGLASPGNRVDIGLTSERLATLGGLLHTRAEPSATVSAASTKASSQVKDPTPPMPQVK